jgi:hypothetical protein
MGRRRRRRKAFLSMLNIAVTVTVEECTCRRRRYVHLLAKKRKIFEMFDLVLQYGMCTYRFF